MRTRWEVDNTLPRSLLRVARMLSLGASNKVIAVACSLSQGSVKQAVHHIMIYFNVRDGNRVRLAIGLKYLFENHMLSPVQQKAVCGETEIEANGRADGQCAASVHAS